MQSGTSLEMSILLRQKEAHQDDRRRPDIGKCPRCHYMNSNYADANGWVEWKVVLDPVRRVYF